MYYKTPQLTKYLAFIIKWRITIISITLISTFFLLFTIPKSTFINNESYWIQGTTKKVSYTTKIFFSPDKIDVNTIAELKKIEIQLQQLKHVTDIESIFSQKKLINDISNSTSSLIKIHSSATLSPQKLLLYITNNPNEFSTVFSMEKKTLTFFIFSTNPINLSNLESSIPYETNNAEEGDSGDQGVVFILLTTIFFILGFYVVFKNFTSGFSATAIVGASTIFSVAFINFFFPDLRIHITSILIIISISLMDYLFFYFRWHSSQTGEYTPQALTRCLNRNFYPALLTVFVAVLGLAPFMVMDSDIINLLALSTIVPTIFVYILNMTTLPAILSFVTLKDGSIPYKTLIKKLALKTINYNKTALSIFIIITMFLSLFWIIKFAMNPSILTNQQKEPAVLSLTVHSPIFDADAIIAIDKFTTKTMTQFPHIKNVDSVPMLIRSILTDETFTEDSINEAFFFLQLYKVTKDYISPNGDCKITFLMDNSVPHNLGISSWVSKNSPYPTTVSNFCSVVEEEKSRHIHVTAQAIASSFILISVFIGLFFRSFWVALATFITSIVPIAWFSFLIWLLDKPITVEVFIAMVLVASLSSVSSVHFAYKFWRSRYFGGNSIESLSYSYFHSSLPVVIGSTILCVSFASLYFSSIPSLQLIGAYSFVLTLFALFADLFILPVLLLAFDKYATH